jgi:hypothetical protein
MGIVGLASNALAEFFVGSKRRVAARHLKCIQRRNLWADRPTPSKITSRSNSRTGAKIATFYESLSIVVPAHVEVISAQAVTSIALDTLIDSWIQLSQRRPIKTISGGSGWAAVQTGAGQS